jgi:hypothetical protein
LLNSKTHEKVSLVTFISSRAATATCTHIYVHVIATGSTIDTKDRIVVIIAQFWNWDLTVLSHILLAFMYGIAAITKLLRVVESIRNAGDTVTTVVTFVFAALAPNELASATQSSEALRTGTMIPVCANSLKVNV